MRLSISRLAKRLLRRRDRNASPRDNTDTVAIFGLFGSGNLGNDASLEAMLSFLKDKHPETRLLCICKEPGVVAKTFRVEAIPIRRWKKRKTAHMINRLVLGVPPMAASFLKAVQSISKVGVMIIPGTGILDDFGDRPVGMPFDIFSWCVAAWLMGTRIAFISIGAGPIENRVSRWLMTSAARIADYRSYRDTASLKFLENAGVDTSGDAIYPDLAFKLPVFKSPVTPPAADAASGRLAVGIGVMNYRGWYGFREGGQVVFDNYIVKMTVFVRFLLDNGHNVRLLTGDENDVPAVEALLASLDKTDADRLFYEPVHSIHDVIGQVLHTDLVVVTRFHNIVAALMAARPVISLGYAAKNDLLLRKVGLGDYCQNIDDFDVGRLIAQFENLAAKREEHVRLIETTVAGFRNSLALQDEYLLSTVFTQTPRNGEGASFIRKL